MKITLKELARKLEATIHIPEGADSEIEVQGVAPIDKASPADVTFLTNPEYEKFAATTGAGTIITARIIERCPKVQLLHKNPYWAFAMAAQWFTAKRTESCSVDPNAFVSKSAKIGKNTTIYPLVYVSEDAEIGDDVVLFPGVFVGRKAKIGSQTVLRSNVVVEDHCIIGDRVLIHGNTTVGADGFGFAKNHSGHAKIPQVGIVRIEDDVEIGSGCTIDRAALGETVIGRGSKLDSSVHVGHGAKIGPHGILCSGAAVGGSAKIGSWVVLAGATSVSNNIEMADHITIGALSGVTKSLREPGEYMGFPAVPANQWRREVAAVRRLKSLDERVRNLEELLIKK